MLPFNFNHFYYFYEVARYGSFTAAARELMVSQSAISIQVKQLERDLGTVLLERRRGGVGLTDAGASAFEVAERIFHDLGSLQSSLRESERRIKGMLSIGTVNGIGIYILPAILTAFREAYPRVKIKIDYKEAEKVLDLLQSGKVDFAIIPSNRKYADLTGIPITRNKMFLVGPADHPLASRESVSPRELEQYEFLGFEEGMQIRSSIDALFKRMAVSVEYSVESANSATIKQMVMTGMGLAVLPDVVVAPEIRRGKIARINAPLLMMSRDIVLYYKTNRALSATRLEFVSFLKDFFSSKRQRPRK